MYFPFFKSQIQTASQKKKLLSLAEQTRYTRTMKFLPLQLVSLLISILLFSSCKDLSKQEVPLHLYTQYYIRYLAPQQQLKAEVSFMEGEAPPSAQPKTFLGGVSFMGNKMELQELQNDQQRYVHTSTIPYPELFNFQYQNNGDLQNNQLSMQPIRQFRVRKPFSKSQGLELVVQDDLLRGNESLVLLFADAQNQAFAHTIQGPGRDSVFSISADALTGLPTGPSTLYLVKRLERIQEQNRQSITTTIEYYTDTIRVEVLE